MSEKDEALEILATVIEANGTQAEGLEAIEQKLTEMAARAAFIYGEGSQQVGHIGQASSYIRNARGVVSPLGVELESAATFISGLGEN